MIFDILTIITYSMLIFGEMLYKYGIVIEILDDLIFKGAIERFLERRLAAAESKRKKELTKKDHEIINFVICCMVGIGPLALILWYGPKWIIRFIRKRKRAK